MKFLSKSQQDFFVDIDKIILKLLWKGKVTKIVKSTLKKNNVKKKNNFKNYNIVRVMKVYGIGRGIENGTGWKA